MFVIGGISANKQKKNLLQGMIYDILVFWINCSLRMEL